MKWTKITPSFQPEENIDGSVVGQPVDEHGDDTAVAYIQATKPQIV